MTALFLYDDARARRFEPFASTRPISEMRAGIALIRDRWAAALGLSDARFLAGPRHADFDEPGAHAAEGVIPAGSIIANARCAPALLRDPARAARSTAGCSLWKSGERLAAIRTGQPLDAAVFADGSVSLDQLRTGTGAVGTVAGWWIDEVWDFVRLLPDWLRQDIVSVMERDGIPAGAPAHSTVIGEHPVVLRPATAGGSASPVIEPHVVFDASQGPIFVDAGSHVHAFTRLVGPCHIGREVQVLGGDIAGSAIGDVSKVRGEVSSTVFLGHSNKGHEGFIGHSYLGRWVNLGAGTITSNLKNTYGPVTLWTPDGVRDTGMQFLGTLFGDHVKTGIGLRLTTGTVIGAGANVVGGMPPKAVAPFSWGDPASFSEYQADKFLETAARVMARRHVTLSERAHRHLRAVHAARWTVEAEPR